MNEKNPNAATPVDLQHAEKLAAVSYTQAERDQIVRTIGELIDGYVKLRSVPIPNELPPAVLFRPIAPAVHAANTPAAGHGSSGTAMGRALPTPRYRLPLPGSDEDIAFAPVANLAEWIRSGALSSLRLTEIYLDRLERFSPTLNCTITLTRERALKAAKRADEELHSGIDRGPLHGIPWGAKDLFDTAGIATTYGAEPYRDRVPTADAAVVRSLDAAGAVLVAKLSLGALAYNDIWFGGQTKNPWDVAEGSSGSSAGSAAATAAGLVGFSLGTETMGSIVSPSLRCGTAGLRPSFGRVPRTGAMALCWSFDKIGPICRTVDDTMLVLEAIAGHDEGDLDSIDLPVDRAAGFSAEGLRVGYRGSWFEAKEATEADRTALAALRDLGAELVELDLPDLPYEQIMLLVYAEAAAAFEELTLSDTDDTLSWQDDEAWPNTFRMSRFIPAIEYVQAQRFRRVLMQLMDGVFSEVAVIVSPQQVESLVYATNATGHPSLTLRAGFDESGKPHGINLWGRLYDEGTLTALGALLEERLGVWERRPEL